MTVRRLSWAALMGLALVSGRGVYAEPPPSAKPALNLLPALEVNDAQKLADTIAAHLRSSGQLHDYRVDIAVRGGDVELIGSIVSQPQREEVLRLVQGVPGVVHVLDHLAIVTGNTIKRVQAEADKVPPPPPPGSPEAEKGRLPAPLDNGGRPPAGPGSGTAPGAGAMGNGNLPEPVPMFSAPPPGFHDVNPPKMPPYAWPTYAPYNNFSRVGYPKAYPYNAWPFIGPVYPFPKIPLGWRSVKLEWDDGYWWYGRVGCKYDWWKIRYW